MKVGAQREERPTPDVGKEPSPPDHQGKGKGINNWIEQIEQLDGFTDVETCWDPINTSESAERLESKRDIG